MIDIFHLGLDKGHVPLAYNYLCLDIIACCGGGMSTYKLEQEKDPKACVDVFVYFFYAMDYKRANMSAHHK